MAIPQERSGLLSGGAIPWIDDVYSVYTKRRRQPRVIRILAVVFFVSFVYILFMHTIGPTTWNNEVVVDIATDGSSPEFEELGGHYKGKSKTDADILDYMAEEDRAALEAQLETKTPDTVRFESHLRHLLAIAPDELHVKELLRPIEGTGNQRLHETALRARAFRALFEPWEDLHVVATSNSTFIRDDVVPYLRKVDDISGISVTMSRGEMIRTYENYRYFLTKFSALLFPWISPYFADHMTLHAHLRHGGRGIVLSGGDRQAAFMQTSIKILRKLGTTLPIEIMYLGDHDLSEASRSELEALPGVVTRDVHQMVDQQGWSLRGWAGKPFAILLSSFREVLFIDADSFFFQNPDSLFEDPGYEETGALFFHDRLMFPESKKKWLTQILPKPLSESVRKSRLWTGESGHMQESGVVVVDKWKHFMALLMVTRMNGPDRDGDKEKGVVGVYDMVYGDKETFWLGWELVGDTDYAFHPGDTGSMGIAHADRGESPIIAATADRIGKHAELGALAGSYDTTLFLMEEGDKRFLEDKFDKDAERVMKEDQAKKEEKKIEMEKGEEMEMEKEKQKEKEKEKEKEKGKEQQAESPEDSRPFEDTLASDADELDSEEFSSEEALDRENLDDWIDPLDLEEIPEKKGTKGEADSEGLDFIESLDYDDLDLDTQGEGLAEDPAEEMPKQQGKSKHQAKPKIHARRNAFKSSHQALHKGKVHTPDPDLDTNAEAEAALAYSAALKAEGEDDGDDDDEPIIPPTPKGQPVPSPELVDSNYTICAPQLLHFDRGGRPLWFNGWIVDNKFDLSHAEISKFSVFMREKRADDSNGRWMMQGNNMYCLQSDILHRFSKRERRALDAIIETAKEVGAVGASGTVGLGHFPLHPGIGH